MIFITMIDGIIEKRWIFFRCDLLKWIYLKIQFCKIFWIRISIGVDAKLGLKFREATIRCAELAALPASLAKMGDGQTRLQDGSAGFKVGFMSSRATMSKMAFQSECSISYNVRTVA